MPCKTRIPISVVEQTETGSRMDQFLATSTRLTQTKPTCDPNSRNKWREIPIANFGVSTKIRQATKRRIIGRKFGAALVIT
jgi:hypothetical protein